MRKQKRGKAGGRWVPISFFECEGLRAPAQGGCRENRVVKPSGIW
ncbi:hypothetical protein CLOSTASPAR_02072 [[Clostridium] asparagiforme DSM 15981]|uniref:Uncharacterized protein n=1 Tax=[Clostridium] asparagiforme DSM 15981 TaxID=518636 RepID=C0CYJ6_9FIRM|nr:hypothetical protein CLOSTASPAR_02072 [[Clostridium] asparagiforme DSM 15981]